MNSKKDLLKDIKYRGMQNGCICATIITVIVIGIFLFGKRIKEIGLKRFLDSLQSQESNNREIAIIFVFIVTYLTVVIIAIVTIIKMYKRRVEVLEKELSNRGMFYEIVNKDYVRGISISNDNDIYNIGKKYTVVTDANQIYILQNSDMEEIRLEKRKDVFGIAKYYLVILINKEIIEINTEKNRINEIMTVYRKMGIGRN